MYYLEQTEVMIEKCMDCQTNFILGDFSQF